MWHLKKINKIKSKAPRSSIQGQLGVCRRWAVGVCEEGEGGQKVQTSNYRKITHGIIMCSMAAIANNTILKNYFVYLKIAKRVDLKSPLHTHTQKM